MLDRYRSHVNSGLARILGLGGAPLEARAEGLHVFDEDGRRHLDCGGYCVFLLGHRHPQVCAAVADQLRVRPLATKSMADPLLAEAAAAVAQVSPEGLEYTWLANSGSEAVEAALKLARLNGCDSIIAADGGFHGKTTGALAVSGRSRYRDPFEPLLPGIQRVPFGDAPALAGALKAAPGRVAVVLEPLQSEAGVVLPPASYLGAVRRACNRDGAILVVDEISTGLGRTGRWWGVEHDSVRPDILLTGKALGGGVVPVAAMVTTPELFEPLNREPLLHSSTFAGNPLAARATVAALAAMTEIDLPARADRLGNRLLAAIRGLCACYEPDLVAAVRGRGLLIGIEMRHEHLAAELILELLERRVIVSHSLNAHPVVRLTPSVLLDEESVDWLLTALAGSLRAVAAHFEPDTGKLDGVRGAA